LREDEEPKLVVNQAQLITEAIKQKEQKTETDGKKLYLRFMLGKDYLLECIKTILSAHHGTVPVCIHIEETGTTAMAQQALWVQADETLLMELREVLGAENVVLK